MGVPASEVTAHKDEVQPIEASSVWSDLMGVNDVKLGVGKAAEQAKLVEGGPRRKKKGLSIDFSVKEKRNARNPAAAKADKRKERADQKKLEAELKAMTRGGVRIAGLKVPKQNLSIEDGTPTHVKKAPKKKKASKKKKKKMSRQDRAAWRSIRSRMAKMRRHRSRVAKRLRSKRKLVWSLRSKLRKANRTIRHLRSKLEQAQLNHAKSLRIKDPSIKNAFRSTRRSLHRLRNVLKGGMGEEDEEEDEEKDAAPAPAPAT